MMLYDKSPPGDLTVIQDLNQGFRIMNKINPFYKNGYTQYYPDNVYPTRMVHIDKLLERFYLI
jgi:hypothetical protein